MPKIAKTLTDLQVKKLTTDGYYAVGGVAGLYLRVVTPNKYWVFRYKLNGKRRDLQFDKYPNVSLKIAREQAEDFKKLQKQGIDPNNFAFLAYDSAMVLMEAYDNATTKDDAGIVEALKATDYTGILGHLSFDENGDPIRDIQIVTVIDGKYKINYKPKNRLPIEEFLKPQRRFKHMFKPGNEWMIKEFQEEVDKRWQ